MQLKFNFNICSICNQRDATYLKIDLFPEKKYCWACFNKSIKELRKVYDNLTIAGELLDRKIK